MARIIIDAGPLIAFAKIGQLSLLQQLFGQMMVAESVYQECTAKPSREEGMFSDLLQADWVEIVPMPEAQNSRSRSLGRGELDCIGLAMEKPSESLLILDDRLARRHAMQLKLNFIGTVRILDMAEQRDLISNADSLIDEMRKHGYRIHPDLLRSIRLV